MFQGGGAGDWLINGEAWPNVTARTAALGADTVIEVRNLSSTNHPFHLHGMAFEVLSIDGAPPAQRRDDLREQSATVRRRIALDGIDHRLRPRPW